MQPGAFGKRPVKKGFSSSSLRRSTSFFTPHLARQPLEQETILVSMVLAALVARAGGGHRQRCKFWRTGDEWKDVWKGRLGNKVLGLKHQTLHVGHVFLQLETTTGS